MPYCEKVISFSLTDENDKKKMDNKINSYLDEGWYVKKVEVSNTAVVFVLTTNSRYA